MNQQDIERFRASALKWRTAAGEAASEEDRRNCLTLADGYERLVEIMISTGNRPGQTPQCGHMAG